MAFLISFYYFELRSKVLTFGKSQINLHFHSLIRTFAPVKRKSVAFIVLSVLIMFGACTPLSLLHKGRKAVKEAESYANATGVKAMAQRASFEERGTRRSALPLCSAKNEEGGRRNEERGGV